MPDITDLKSCISELLASHPAACQEGQVQELCAFAEHMPVLVVCDGPDCLVLHATHQVGAELHRKLEENDFPHGLLAFKVHQDVRMLTCQEAFREVENLPVDFDALLLPQYQGPLNEKQHRGLLCLLDVHLQDQHNRFAKAEELQSLLSQMLLPEDPPLRVLKARTLIQHAARTMRPFLNFQL